MKKIFVTRELQKGLTIVEMLMYMAIFAVLMTILTQVFLSTLDVQLESKATSSVSQDGSYMLARLSYDIKRSQAVLSPTTYGQPSNTLQLNENGITYTYTTDTNGNLLIVNNQGTNYLNSADTTVNNLSFTRIGNVGGKSTILLSFQVKSTTQRVQGYQTSNFQTAVSLR